MNNMESISSLKEKLERKEISAREIAEHYLRIIEQRDPEINAFITPTPDFALQQASYVDSLIAEGRPLPPLAGIPYALKDAILARGIRCTAGSRILEQYIASYDATVTKRMYEAGAVLVGKTNMDEFGMGASTENSAFGPTRNPSDTSRVAGGSSGGSAASVAAGECIAALGEDTGGSIRLPAAFCGVVGLKPTYGAVSRYGVIALASSLDQVGPFAKTAEDAERVFRALLGSDPQDATSIDFPENAWGRPFDIKKLRIGIPKEYFEEGLDPQVKMVVERAIERLRSQGAQIKEIVLPHTKYALATYYIINTSEASANLARYDGVRYGKTKQRGDLLGTYLASRGSYFGPEVKRRIMLGTYALSAGYYDAYYVKAQKIRSILKQDFDNVFQEVDVIAGPVSPTLPFRIGERVQDPLSMYLVDIYTVPANLVGIPALSVPAGKAEHLSVAIQFIGPAFSEPLLFQIGKAFETLTNEKG